MSITIITVNIAWLSSAAVFKLYKYKVISQIDSLFRKTWRTWLLQLLICYSIFAPLISFSFAGYFFVTYGLLAGGSMFLTRFFQTYLIETIFKRIKVAQKIGIVGCDEKALQLEKYFHRNKNIYNLSTIFSDEQPEGVRLKTPVVSLENCISYAVSNNIRELYSTLLPHEHPIIPSLVHQADRNCLRIKFVSEKISYTDAYRAYVKVDHINEMHVTSLRSEPLFMLMNRLKKRAFDVIISSFVVLFILSWLVPLLGLIIKLNSRGPVFFVQERSGKNNTTFRCLKFRSMKVNNESNNSQAIKNDARITKVGAFIRKTSIDELPQFFNVLTGSMSLCGPRPHMLKHTTEYSRIIHTYMIRHFLKPGITGWAQVNGFRGETDDYLLMEKRVEHDIWYMENWSLMLDVRIIFLTIINIFKGEELAR